MTADVRGPGGAPAPRGAGYAVGAVFGLRVAGVRADLLDGLRSTRTWDRVEELLRLTDQVREEGRRLADELHGVIPAEGPGPHRGRLIALRRDLFAARALPARTWSPEVRSHLPEDLSRRITAWTARQERLRGIEADLPALLDAERSRATVALRSAVSGNQFRQGLDQSSVALSTALTKWLSAEAGSSPRPQTALRLAKYLARAAMKTSPFGTFTTSALGHWAAPDDPGQVLVTHDLQPIDVIEVDRLVVHLAWSVLVERPGLRDALELRGNSSALEEDGRIWFLGAGPEEPLRSTTASPGVRAVLDVVRSHPGSVHGDVIDRLVGPIPAPGERDRADSFLTGLIGLGLIEVRRPFTDQSIDPLAELIDWLARTAVDQDPLLASLREVLGSAAVLSRAGDSGTRRRWADMPRSTVAFLDQVKAGMPSPEQIVHASSVAPGSAMTLSGEALQQVLDDLDRVRRLIPILDPSVPVKLAASDFFHQVHGVEGAVSFLRFYRELHDPTLLAKVPAGRAVRRLLPRLPSRRPSAGDRAPDDHGPRLRAFRELRRSVWDALRAAQATVGQGGSIPVTLLPELIAGRPGYLRPAESICCYGQLASTAEGPRFVLNMIAPGPGRGIGRIEHLVRLATAPDSPGPASDVAAVGPGTASGAAEFRNDHLSSLDQRRRTAQVIDYPFSTADVEPSMTLADLRVEYDRRAGLIVLRGPDGTVVRPVHLGLVSELRLAPAQSALIRLFGAPANLLMPGWLLRGGLSRPAIAEVEDLPRITLGTVVLCRRCWRMRAGTIPAPGKGESETGHLIRFARWLSGNGIPRQFFARVIDLDGGGKYSVYGKGKKPVFVDVTNGFLLKDFLRALDHPDRLVVLEEVLPLPADAPGYADAGDRVTEHIFELSSRSESPVPEGRRIST